MKKGTEVSLVKLFFSALKISAFTFGGGFVIVPLMKRQFSDRLHWIAEDEMMDLVAISQSSPGAIAVNASILVGYRVRGFVGACTALLATILPPFVILSVISVFYRAFRDSKIVSMIMAGMFAGVAAVVLDVVCRMAAEVFKKTRFRYVPVMIAAFAALYFFSVNPVIILFVCGVIGALDARRSRKQRKEGAEK